MDLATAHLRPIFANTVALLSPSPEQLATFETWAASQVYRLHAAAKQGPAALSFEAELLREDLHALGATESFEAVLTERTERMRLCQRQWLTGLLDFVDDVLDDVAPRWMAPAA